MSAGCDAARGTIDVFHRSGLDGQPDGMRCGRAPAAGEQPVSDDAVPHPQGDRAKVVVTNDQAGAATVRAPVAAVLLVVGWLVRDELLGQGGGQEHGSVLGPCVGVDFPRQEAAGTVGDGHGWWSFPADSGVVGPYGGAEQMEGGS